MECTQRMDLSPEPGEDAGPGAGAVLGHLRVLGPEPATFPLLSRVSYRIGRAAKDSNIVVDNKVRGDGSAEKPLWIGTRKMAV